MREPDQQIFFVVALLRERDRIEIHIARHRASPLNRTPLRVANILGNRGEPRRLALGNDSTAEGSERMEERRLYRILGLGARSKLAEAVAVNAFRVVREELARCVYSILPRR